MIKLLRRLLTFFEGRLEVLTRSINVIFSREDTASYFRIRWALLHVSRSMTGIVAATFTETQGVAITLLFGR